MLLLSNLPSARSTSAPEGPFSLEGPENETHRLKRFFSGRKALRALCRVPALVTNLKQQGRLLRTLLGNPATRSVLVKQPVLPFKYLSHDYLVCSGLTVSDRTSALMHHYEFLDSTFRCSFQTKLFGAGIPLFKSKKDLRRHRVDLVISSPCYEEGELSLFFKCDGVELYCLSFTFVPGRLFGIDAPTVLLLSRSQGKSGLYPMIRTAMKAVAHMSLPMFMMSLLEGLAAAAGVRHLVGVSASNLSPRWQGRTGTLLKAYDIFFESLGATRGTAGFYHSALPLAEKPFSLIGACNRSRSRAQRQLKAEAREKAYQILARNRNILVR